jgi:TonB family protein
MPLCRLWSLVLAASVPAMCLASIEGSALRAASGQVSLAAREHQVWASAVHESEFATVPHTTARATCEATQPPQALATPNPLFDRPDASAKVTVSFIIGTDGRVNSPLILQSAGAAEDRTVLNAVRSWRYRPALCNGVPTESEAKVEFSTRQGKISTKMSAR